jgi:ferredoxin/flavodoxin---NADP+ reductase
LESKVDVKTSLNVKAIEGEDGNVKELVLASKDGSEERIAVDHLIVNYGNISSLGPLKEWGVDMDRNSIIVNSRMETNIEGIYAAGDVTTYDGKVKLIAVGLGEAPIAVNHAKAHIDPKARLQPLHSTSIFS